MSVKLVTNEYSQFNYYLSRLAEPLRQRIFEANEAGILCPNYDLVFRAIKEMRPAELQVVILGQDPYHTAGKASGLAFGYNREYEGFIDSSLMNIFDEVRANFNGELHTDRTLESWADQGVLLLNTRLTTEIGKPLAHANLGWESFIKDFLGQLPPHLVYMLWGQEAQSYESSLPPGDKLVLATSHPCKFSAHRGFQGCGHFAIANEYLESIERKGVKW